jgi:hypothetical protein
VISESVAGKTHHLAPLLQFVTRHELLAPKRELCPVFLWLGRHIVPGFR